MEFQTFPDLILHSLFIAKGDDITGSRREYDATVHFTQKYFLHDFEICFTFISYISDTYP